MSTHSRRTKNFVYAGVGLLVARAAFPLVLTRLANLGARRIPGYRARVRWVNLDVITPRLTVTGVSLVQLNGGNSPQIDPIVLGNRWIDLLRSSLTAYLRVDSPRVVLDFRGLSHAATRRAFPCYSALWPDAGIG
jgi:hypothetical protein